MKSNKGTRTLTIGELAIRIKSLDSIAIDTAVASEFDVEVDYTYLPRIPASRLSGAFEDADPGEAAECEIKAIQASANVHFEGSESATVIKRGSDLMPLFTGAQVAALEDRIILAIEKGGSDD